jgi:hypothetical protein
VDFLCPESDAWVASVRGETGCGNWNPPGAGAYDGSVPVSDVSANPPEAQASTADLSVVNSAPSPSAACTPERSSKARTSVRGVGKAEPDTQHALLEIRRIEKYQRRSKAVEHQKQLRRLSRSRFPRGEETASAHISLCKFGDLASSLSPPPYPAPSRDRAYVAKRPSGAERSVVRHAGVIGFLDDEVKIDFLRRTVQLEGANKRRVTRKRRIEWQ